MKNVLIAFVINKLKPDNNLLMINPIKKLKKKKIKKIHVL